MLDKIDKSYKDYESTREKIDNLKEKYKCESLETVYLKIKGEDIWI